MSQKIAERENCPQRQISVHKESTWKIPCYLRGGQKGQKEQMAACTWNYAQLYHVQVASLAQSLEDKDQEHIMTWGMSD